MATKDEEFEVGYGRPPRHTRFTKGHSGNPNGRPKRQDDLTRLLKQISARRVSVRQHGRTDRMTTNEVVLMTLARDAMKGDPQARRLWIELMRHVEATIPASEPAPNEPLTESDEAIIERHNAKVITRHMSRRGDASDD